MIVWSRPIKQPHREDVVKDWIHNSMTPPLYKLVTSFGSPEPESIIVVEVVGHIVTPMMEAMLCTMTFVPWVDFVGIHTLPDL